MKGLGVESEAVLVFSPGGWKALSLRAVGKCARVFVSPLVFGFLLNVCSARSLVIDMAMCLDIYGYILLEPLCSASWGEQTVEQSLPPGSQEEKDRQEGTRVPVPFQGTPCLTSWQPGSEGQAGRN